MPPDTTRSPSRSLAKPSDESTATRHAESTLATATALNPHIGYDRAAAIVKEATESGRILREVAREHGVEEEVLEEVFARFGDGIRPLPRAEGIGVTAYALPIGAFLVGGGIVFVVLRRLTGGGEAGGSSEAPSGPRGGAASTSDDELARIVDEELRG